jgi:hypothetical protein
VHTNIPTRIWSNHTYLHTYIHIQRYLQSIRAYRHTNRHMQYSYIRTHKHAYRVFIDTYMHIHTLCTSCTYVAYPYIGVLRSGFSGPDYTVALQDVASIGNYGAEKLPGSLRLANGIMDNHVIESPQARHTSLAPFGRVSFSCVCLSSCY